MMIARPIGKDIFTPGHRCPQPLPQPLPGLPKPPIDWDRYADQAAFKKLDKDGDGVLSRNEFGGPQIRWMGKTLQDRFAKFDTDRDGNVDGKEYHAGRERERMIDRLFKDGGALGGLKHWLG